MLVHRALCTAWWQSNSCSVEWAWGLPSCAAPAVRWAAATLRSCPARAPPASLGGYQGPLQCAACCKQRLQGSNAQHGTAQQGLADRR